MKIFYKDGMCEEGEAKLPIFSSAVQFGITPFEGIGVYKISDNLYRILDGKRHIDRLYKSAQALDIAFNLEPSRVSSALVEYVRYFVTQNHCDFTMRVLLVPEIGGWGGDLSANLAIKGLARDPERRDKNLIASVVGVERISFNNIDPTVKVGANYLNSRYAMLEAKELGTDVAIFLDRSGFVCEAMGSGVGFIDRHGTIFFTVTEHGKLDSITRHRIRSIPGLVFEDKFIQPTDMNNFSACFLYGTALEVTPVINIKTTNQLFEFDVEIARGLCEKYFEDIGRLKLGDIDVPL